MAGPKQHPDDSALQSFPSKPQKTKTHMFFPFLWTHLLFLPVGLGASEKGSTPAVVPGILGGLVIFPLNISVDTEFENVAWSGPQGTLAFATAEKQIFITAKSYQDRLNISWDSYSLRLSNLTLEDAGPYKAQINRKTSAVTTDKAFILHVYEQVPEPQVIVKSVNMSDSGSCNITLICSVERAWTSVLYSWTLQDTQASESQEGSTVTIRRTLCDPDLPYTCTARNPVSQSTSSPIHARQFCIAPEASGGDSMGETVVGILGESVTLPLTLSARHSGEKVIWMFNTSIISKERKAAATADPFVKFKDASKNSSQDYSLMIGRLKMENAGHYHAYVCSQASGVISTKHITLRVYGCQKLDTFSETVKQRHRPASDSSSESSETKEKDRERTGIPKAGRHHEYDLLTQEDTGSDSSSEGQEEYDLVTPKSMVPAPEDNTVYMQVVLNLQGNTPVPERKESSATVYSCVQILQKVVPSPQQNDPESSEIPTYENFT
ncbi:T-lymphocyte surface antigen Ly-9 isoform X3 [Lutra lutra]|uniref:T-lymphocyte surface antigen Ly-9 isoform X3 n=1 Tax=Lutra lutra TaxID=9657 RepID=UPI001FD36CB1|nr:T-lymphocyte surface antigen Ly-9 isoform X3 [Lutra lutra]